MWSSITGAWSSRAWSIESLSGEINKAGHDSERVSSAPCALNNPNKDEFTKNHLLNLSFFYKVNDYGIFYLKLSASSNYLLGENPLAYNRRSNHLFDHPYGQINAGIIINF